MTGCWRRLAIPSPLILLGNDCHWASPRWISPPRECTPKKHVAFQTSSSSRSILTIVLPGSGKGVVPLPAPPHRKDAEPCLGGGGGVHPDHHGPGEETGAQTGVTNTWRSGTPTLLWRKTLSPRRNTRASLPEGTGHRRVFALPGGVRLGPLRAARWPLRPRTMPHCGPGCR